MKRITMAATMVAIILIIFGVFLIENTNTAEPEKDTQELTEFEKYVGGSDILEIRNAQNQSHMDSDCIQQSRVE